MNRADRLVTSRFRRDIDVISSTSSGSMQVSQAILAAYRAFNCCATSVERRSVILPCGGSQAPPGVLFCAALDEGHKPVVEMG
jgi:hypothetical protein